MKDFSHLLIDVLDNFHSFCAEKFVKDVLVAQDYLPLT